MDETGAHYTEWGIFHRTRINNFTICMEIHIILPILLNSNENIHSHIVSCN